MTTHVQATARYVRVAPNKVRQVVAHIRGRRVEDARRVLLLSPKEISDQILKTLNSAVANAENNHDLDPDDLYVTAAIVNEGPQLKRFQPRAMGRAYRIRKRTSHITISVATENTPPPRANRRIQGPVAVLAPEPAPAPVEEPRKRASTGRKKKAAETPAAATEDTTVEETVEETAADETPATDAATTDTVDETTADDAAAADDKPDDTPAADADKE